MPTQNDNFPEMDHPDTCSVVGCGKLTEFKAVGKIWRVDTPARARTDANCAVLEIGVAFCADHKHHLKAEDFLTDDGWAVLTQPFRQMGLPLPDRTSLVIGAVPLPSTPKESQA